MPEAPQNDAAASDTTASNATASNATASITTDDVAKVASLARLTLTDAELDLFTGQLQSILDHAEDVAALDLDDVEPTAHPIPLHNVTRPDEVTECLDRDEVLSQAPATEAGMFRVPPVLGEAP